MRYHADNITVRRVESAVHLSQRIRGLCVNGTQVIYESAFSAEAFFVLFVFFLAQVELSLSMKESITLEMCTEGCNWSPGQ